MTNFDRTSATVVCEADAEAAAFHVCSALAAPVAADGTFYWEVRESFRCELPMDGPYLRDWCAYASGSREHPDGADRFHVPLGTDKHANGLYAVYRDLIPALRACCGQLLDERSANLTCAFVWPRHVAEDTANLRAHHYMFRAFADAEGLGNLRFLAVSRDAAVAQVALATHAGASGQAAQLRQGPYDTLAGAATIALAWDAGTRLAAEVRRRLAPDATRNGERGPVRLGILQILADGAVTAAWADEVACMVAGWRRAVRAEAAAIATGRASPFRARHDEHIFICGSSPGMARQQVGEECLTGIACRLREATCRLLTSHLRRAFAVVPGYVKADALPDGIRCSLFAEEDFEREVRWRFWQATAIAMDNLPWPVAAVASGADLAPAPDARDGDAGPVYRDEALERALDAREGELTALLLGYGRELSGGLGFDVARRLWDYAGGYALLRCDTTGCLAVPGKGAVWPYDSGAAGAVF